MKWIFSLMLLILINRQSYCQLKFGNESLSVFKKGIVFKYKKTVRHFNNIGNVADKKSSYYLIKVLNVEKKNDTLVVFFNKSFDTDAYGDKPKEPQVVIFTPEAIYTKRMGEDKGKRNDSSMSLNNISSLLDRCFDLLMFWREPTGTENKKLRQFFLDSVKLNKSVIVNGKSYKTTIYSINRTQSLRSWDYDFSDKFGFTNVDISYGGNAQLSTKFELIGIQRYK